MNLTAPYTLPGGQRVWLDAEVQEFIQRLADLDPSLALYHDPDGSWIIARIAEDASIHYVMRSKPGARLGPHVIAKLVEGDTRRQGNDPVERMLAHNEKVQRDAEAAAEEATLVAIDKMLSKSWRGRITSTIEDSDI